MKLISSKCNVMDAIYGIIAGDYSPIVDNGIHYYYIDVEKWGNGTLYYTTFNKTTLEPVESWEVKFGSYHIMYQIIYDPLPKIKLESIKHVTLPTLPPEIVDPTVILSYYR